MYWYYAILERQLKLRANKYAMKMLQTTAVFQSFTGGQGLW
jgi:hypothetical protein